MIEPNVMLECVLNFCYLGDRLGTDGGVEEASRKICTITQCFFQPQRIGRVFRIKKISSVNVYQTIDFWMLSDARLEVYETLLVMLNK